MVLFVLFCFLFFCPLRFFILCFYTSICNEDFYFSYSVYVSGKDVKYDYHLVQWRHLILQPSYAKDLFRTHLLMLQHDILGKG